MERAFDGGGASVRFLHPRLQTFRSPLDIRSSAFLHLELVLALLLQATHRVLRLGHALRHLATLSLAPNAQTLLRGDQATFTLLRRRQSAGEFLFSRRALFFEA